MATTTLHGFTPKAKVEARLRASDIYAPGAATASTGTADASGDVKLSGLDVGVQYWVSNDKTSEVRTIQGKDESFNEDSVLHRDGPEATVRRLQADRQAQADARAKAEKSDPLVASPAPGRNVTDNSPKKRAPSVAEPQPGPRQDETSGPQRSDTPDGEGTPKLDAKEFQPQVPQEEVGKNTAQRSSTETGAAAIKPADEVVPSARQEDVSSSTPQRSSTETGTAEPKPAPKGAHVKEREDASASQARGRTAVKAEENVTGKRTAKQTTKTGTTKRSSSRSKSKSKS